MAIDKFSYKDYYLYYRESIFFIFKEISNFDNEFKIFLKSFKYSLNLSYFFLLFYTIYYPIWYIFL